MRSFCILSLLVSVLPNTSFVSAGHARIQAVHNVHHGVKRQTPADLGLAEQKIPPPEKRQGNGARFTYYVAGLGACGGYNSPNDLIVALNEYQWDNGAHCNQQITININGHTETATVTDLCPFDSCPPGALDFSRGLFSKWSDNPERDGVLFGQWWFGNGQPQQPPTTHQEPTTTTEAPPPPPPTTTSTTQPPPPTTTTSTTPSPPPTTTSSEPTSSSTSSTPTSTSTEGSSTSTSESAPTSSSAPAPPGVISDAQDVFAGFGAFLTAALSITV